MTVHEEPMARDSLFLLDGHSYLYRAFHALPHLSNSKGLPTNAIYGFTTMLSKIIREKQPAYIAVAFDSDKPTHRHEAFEAYKAHRPPMPDSLVVQIPYVRKVVEAYHIPVLIQDGVEADDLIGTVAKTAENAGLDVMIVSGDKDMFQMVSPRIRIYDSMRDKVYGEEEVREKIGVPPAQVVDVMALMGDAVDNIPGVPGVGEKTAVGLIQQFGSLDETLAHLDAVKKPKLREALRDYSKQVQMNRELAKLKLDPPWEGDIKSLKRVEPNSQALTQLFTEFEFSRLLKNLSSPEMLPARRSDPPDSSGPDDSSGMSHQANGPGVDQEEVVSPERFIALARQDGEVCVVGILSPPSLLRPTLLGVAFCCGLGRRIYVDLRPEGPFEPKQSSFLLPSEAQGFTGTGTIDLVREILSDSQIKKVGHDLKPFLLALIQRGINMKGLHFDTMIASYLLSPNRRSRDLLELSMEYLGRPVQIPNHQDVLGKAACEAAEAILQMSAAMRSQLEARGQFSLYHDVELPLIEVLADMEYNGFKIDVDLLGELSKELEIQIQKLTERIYTLAQGEFNLNSPKQLSEVLFERLGLKPVKKTKTGYSTDEGVLSQLAQVHELPAEILNYRQLAKLKFTYVDTLPQMVSPQTRRLHTRFHQTVAATGRLSSSEPNLQNIPIRGEWGRRIRQAFIVQEGNVLVSSDYNQIELRILAHLSQDEQLIQAFQEKRDIHTATAATLFKLPPHLISPEMRRAAKTVNFGVIYGIGPYALSSALGTSQAEAKQYIESYFEYYKGVRQFVEATIQGARRDGHVSTLLNRRREIPEILAGKATIRGQAERIAVNTVIQGSAADLMKLAMVRIFQELRKADLNSRMLLQIHDELIFEVPESELDAMKALVIKQMEGVMPLCIPIKVDLGVGRNWAEIH